MRTHLDDRRLFYGDIFETTDGDVNVVRLYPDAVCAWHRHEKQVDKIFCVSGAVKVGRLDHGTVDWVVLDERRPGPLTIDAGVWHGYGYLEGPCVILQFNSPKYNPNDEERQPVGKMPWVRVPR